MPFRDLPRTSPRIRRMVSASSMTMTSPLYPAAFTTSRMPRRYGIASLPVMSPLMPALFFCDVLTFSLPASHDIERTGLGDLARLLQLEDLAEDAPEIFRRLAARERGDVLLDPLLHLLVEVGRSLVGAAVDERTLRPWRSSDR